MPPKPRSSKSQLAADSYKPSKAAGSKSKARVRASDACDGCRSTKNKCFRDGKSCSLCTKKGVTCITTNSGQKRGPPKGFDVNAEARLDALERMFDLMTNILDHGREEDILELRAMDESTFPKAKIPEGFEM